MGKKIIQIREGDKGLFLSLDKDKDDRITIKQLSLAMEELFGIPDDSEETEDAAHDFQSLLWSVKIDEESFLEIIEKCRLRRLLRQANYGVEESMNQLFEMMDKDGNGKVSKSEYQEWYKKVVEVDSDFEDDSEVADDADIKKKFERKETQQKITDDFKDLDLDGDGSITMKELITKLNPLASISEKEELEVIISSAPNFDLGDGNINMREMIAKSKPSSQGKKLAEEKGLLVVRKFSVDSIEMEKMYQKQFNSRERADFLKDFDLNKDGYVTMKEIKQRTQEKGWKRADFLQEVDMDGDGNIAIKEIITKLNPANIEKKKAEKNELVMRRPRHYGYLDPTLASKAKERKKQASAAAERRYLKEAEPQLEQEQDLDVPRAVSK